MLGLGCLLGGAVGVGMGGGGRRCPKFALFANGDRKLWPLRLCVCNDLPMTPPEETCV